MQTPLNTRIAMKLEEMAELLEQQGANPFRVRAYRQAAGTVSGLSRGVDDILADQGRAGLEALKGVGRGIANAIDEMVRTGRWVQLERLRGGLDPLQTLRTVPGIGPELAERIHDELQVDTLEALELAAHDGRLERVEGIGPRRLAALRASLGAMLGSTRRPATGRGPDVGALLAVDAAYRRAAAAGELPTMAPRRFNPDGRAWLPVLHLERDGWHYTALFSNTARAHELGRTRDWVVIYAYDDHHVESQFTVVTETRGALAGQRVVRGREAECRAWYAAARN